MTYCGERCAATDWPQHCEEEPHQADGQGGGGSGTMNLVWPPHVWLGSIMALNELDAHHVDAVLTVIQRNERNDPAWLAQRIGKQRAWLWLSHHDDPHDDMSVDFERATTFIDKHVRQGHTVLVHCHAGMSRSATMVAAYLLRYHAEQFPSVDAAIAHLQERRHVVAPNTGFRLQLEGWASEWKEPSGSLG